MPTRPQQTKRDSLPASITRRISIPPSRSEVMELLPSSQKLHSRTSLCPPSSSAGPSLPSHPSRPCRLVPPMSAPAPPPSVDPHKWVSPPH